MSVVDSLAIAWHNLEARLSVPVVAPVLGEKDATKGVESQPAVQAGAIALLAHATVSTVAVENESMAQCYCCLGQVATMLGKKYSKGLMCWKCARAVGGYPEFA